MKHRRKTSKKMSALYFQTVVTFSKVLKDIEAIWTLCSPFNLFDFFYLFYFISQIMWKRARVAQTIQTEKGCSFGSCCSSMKLDAAKWPRRLRALCGVRYSSPVLHDVKPHLHHAGPTCHKRSPCRPARRSQRSTRANSDSVLRSP